MSHHSMGLFGGTTLVLVAGMLLCCNTARAPGMPPRNLLQATNCTSVQRCGSGCKPCNAVKDGNPVCLKRGTIYTCSVQCRAGFVLKTAAGALSCSRSTGLKYGGEFLKASRNQTQKSYRDWLAVGDAIRQLGVTTVDKLASVACNSSTIMPECLDALLMGVLPSRYNSNRTTDTGGYAFISPAQDQGECAACVGFASTAALEASVNVYKQQSWSKISLSEQDFNFCKMYPPVDCSSGSSFEQLAKRVMNGKITQLASRSCYPYAFGATGDCDILKCASQLPEGGFTMAYSGAALGTLARVKAAIISQGGVLTAMANLPGFGDYPGTPTKLLYNQEGPSEPDWHAVFCYGFADSATTPGAGYWICKNSWGSSWGLNGTFRIAYGAAYIMALDSTYALHFGPLTDKEQLEAAKTALRQGTIQYLSPNSTGCVLYSIEKPMRLLALHELLSTVAFLGPASTPKIEAPSKAVILSDLLLSNLGHLAELEAANTSLRVCGAAQRLLANALAADVDMQLEALLLIKEALDQKGVLQHWNRSEGAKGKYCEWEEVQCNNSEVTTLAFRNDIFRQLYGTLPPARVVEGLHALRWFSIESQQHIAGTLPSDWALLQLMEHISIQNTKNVSGTIPASWGSLRNLKYLALSDNSLTGLIPESFGGLTALEMLDVSSNVLSGSIPAAISNCTSLRQLHMSGNKLNGLLPDAVGALTSLEVAHFDYNAFSGNIPASLGSLQRLTDLDLTSNQLTSRIPDSLGALAALTQLALGGNELTGSVPASLQGLSAIQFLDLGSNQLYGTLPAWLGSLGTLGSLAMDSNQFTGTLPEEMSILSNLYALSVCNNKLQGSLPDAYKALRHLEVLDVGANLLTGSVPSSWSSMRTITFAGFYNNTGMYGCLPRVWEQSGSFFRDAKRIATYVSAGTNITGLCS